MDGHHGGTQGNPQGRPWLYPALHAHGGACPAPSSPGRRCLCSPVLHSVSGTELSLVNHTIDKHGNKMSLFLMAVVCFFNLWLPFFSWYLYTSGSGKIKKIHSVYNCTSRSGRGFASTPPAEGEVKVPLLARTRSRQVSVQLGPRASPCVARMPSEGH